MSARRSKGFTLVEMMITISVVAIMCAIAYPSFQSTIRSSRVTTTNNEMLALVNLARSEAVRSNLGGGICGSADGSACDGDWSGGMMAFADSDQSGTYDSGETVLRFTMGNPKLRISGPDEPIAFDARGRRRASTDQEVILQADACGTQQLKRTLTVNASGQVRSVKGACS
ncbi:MAG TPA: pre-pilin like leader sequence [Stenotrophomonas sp.]|nr:pre-pilin like leader sequence [Stenotrophomonas sp.]